MAEDKGIIKHASSVTTATLISRVLGYIRDMAIAVVFGAGFAADTFYAAYRIPNLLRRLLGEGSLSTSFVPVFTDYLTNKTEADARRLWNVVFTFLTILLMVLTLLGILFAPQITKLIAWGFTGSEGKLELTILLTRIMFPYLFFICLAALMLATLNSLHIFFIPALAPAMLSVAEILYVGVIAVFFVSVKTDMSTAVVGLSAAVVAGGIGQLVFQLPSLYKRGWVLKFAWDPGHPGLHQILCMMIPAMIGFSVEQINTFVNTVCASFLAEGSVTALYYSNRIVQLPLALFGISIATVSLPLFSRNVAKNDTVALRQNFSQAVRLIIFTILPAMAGLMVLSTPIIRLLFEYGKFTAEATRLTSTAMFFYAIGLVPFAVVKVVAGMFYAYKDTRTPVLVAGAAMALNIVLNIVLMKPLGVGGLALSTSIASFVNVIILGYLLRKKVGLLDGKRISVTFYKCLFAVGVMTIACYLLSGMVFKGSTVLGVLLSVLSSVLIYFGISYFFKLEEFGIMLNLFKLKIVKPK
ncbi:MAG: murein biosynthesis integral membrane protein MurJ [Elusimicrobiota bacterium]